MTRKIPTPDVYRVIYLIALCFLPTQFGYAEQSNESPPFRAWWPIVNKELEAGTRGFATKDSAPKKNNLGKQKYGFGVGFTDRFFVEVEGHLKKSSDGHNQFSAIEIESRYEFTDTKAFDETANPIDIGLLVGIKLPKKRTDSYELESRLLLYKRAGRFRNTFNFIIEKEIGNGESDQIEVGYANQFRYKLTPNIQPGLEIFGRFGKLGNLSYSKQQHNLGPGIFGFIPIKDGISLKYEYTYLLGMTESAPNRTLKWLTEFEYRF